MTHQRERIAWLMFIGIIALVALRMPPGLTPTHRDLEFARSIMELRQQVASRYVREVSDEHLREAALWGMMGMLDEASQLIPAARVEDFRMDIRGAYRGVGILIDRLDDAGGLLVIRALEDSPASRAGVRSGDRIVAVDGQDITAIPQARVVDMIQGPVGTLVTLTIERIAEEERERFDLTMQRAEVASPILEGYRRDAQGQPVFWVDPQAPVKIGYIRLTRFTQGSAAQVRAVILDLLSQGMQGLILDLRFNPGGLLDEGTAIADMFLEEGLIYSKRGAHSPVERAWARSRGTLPPFPLVVMTNELSASASEVLAGALADHGRAVIVGTRSFGKGSVQEVILLSDQSELKLTTAHYYLPSGRLVHKIQGSDDWGVVPDVEVSVDYQDPAELGQADRQPPFPRQVEAAVEVMIGLIAAEENGGGGGRVPPVEEDPATQPAM